MAAGPTDSAEHTAPSADALKAIPLLAHLSETERQSLAATFRTRDVAARQPIFWIGERGQEMFIIDRGSVRLSYPDSDGTDITLAVLDRGAFFGELSLLDDGPRTATARAETDSTLLILDRESFYQFLRNSPDAALQIISILAHRQREAMEKIRGIRNVNQEIDEQIRPLQKLVDRAARVVASGWFLLGNIVFFSLWIAYHTTIHDSPVDFHDDPPTFFWLGFMITVEAILLTMFVLNSQRRQAERDRIRADFEYQVNLKAHLEVMQLHQKVDRLTQSLSELQRRSPRDGEGP